MLRILSTAILLFTVAFLPTAFAHDDASEEASEAMANLLGEIAQNTGEIVSPADTSTAYMWVGGEKIYMNGPFWQLVRGWVRIYYRELQNDCDGCIHWDEEQFMAKAEDEIARSFMQMKVTGPLMESIEHISVGTADLGARLGMTALVAKAASEIGETVLSKVVGGGGVHVFCNAIDAAILFGTRYLQTGWRLWAWSPRAGDWRLKSLIKAGFVSASVRRAQKRATFVAEKVDVSEEELREVDMQGPKRWWGWAKDGKRAAWVKKLLAKGELKVQRRNFLGRKKRYLLLKGNAQFMRGKTDMDKMLNRKTFANRNSLWVMSIQENILQRSLIRDEAAASVAADPPLSVRATPMTDEIREGLAAEFMPENVEYMSSLLREVEVIFNPNVPRRTRYFQATVLENLLAGVLGPIFTRALDKQGEMYGNSLKGIWRQSRLHWRAGRFTSYIYEWSDFLRVSALVGNAEQLQKNKYEAMEALIRLFRHVENAKSLVAAETVGDLMQSEDLFHAGNRELRSFRPWIEKRRAYSWKPWGRTATCRELNEDKL